MNINKPLSTKQALGVIVSIGAVALFVLVLGIALSGDGSSQQQTSGPQEARTLGQEGFIRLAGNNDPEQIMLMAPTKDLWDEVGKALQSNDSYGLLQLTKKGIFGVSNGTQVKVIDTSFTLTRVRILKGVRSVDDDKVGRDGWIPKEWVVIQ